MKNKCRIAIASYTPYLKDVDDAILKKYLINEGAMVDIISWTDKEYDWEKTDAVIIRSTWDYHETINEYYNWLSLLKKLNAKVYNDVDIIKKNIQKDLQIKWIKENNLPHIPCEVFSIYSDNFLNPEKSIKDTIKKHFPNHYEKNMFVIKPTISARSKNTYLVDPFNVNRDENAHVTPDSDKVFKELLAKFNDRGIILQVYCKGIEKGEYAMVFLNGKMVETVMKMPGKLYGDKEKISLEKLDDRIIELGNQVANLFPLDKVLILRVDAVLDDDKPKLMEIELAEPNIYIRATDGVGLNVYDPEWYLPEVERLGCQNEKLIDFAKNIVERAMQK